MILCYLFIAFQPNLSAIEQARLVRAVKTSHQGPVEVVPFNGRNLRLVNIYTGTYE